MSKKQHPPVNAQAQIQAKEELAHQVVGIIEQQYSGPLPPPQVLQQYDNIIPNGAERIMAMAEAQSAHRRGLEKDALATDSRNSLLGICFAFIIGMTTVITGGIIISRGHAWPGTFLGSAGLVGLVSAFIYGTKQRRAEREAKNRAR
jgi:uncharacterized membrane protein